MKIKRIKWNNHPVLGNLELDFTKPSGEIFENIIFAGENGSGKTTILELTSTFLSKGSFEFFEFIEYEKDDKALKAVQPNNAHNKDFYDMMDAGQRIQMHTNRNNRNEIVDNNPLNIRYDGCVFSKARADYKTQQIRSTTTRQLDQDKFDVDKEDDFTSLKQLIVDVEDQDNSLYAETNKEIGSSPKSWEEFYPDSKLYRFKNAFDNFFEQLEYHKVENENSEKIIKFRKHGNSISIDSLSTGEKQIVFRGIFLLKNSKNLNGAAIMIDEPELSMHPIWQKKILRYYKELFTQEEEQVAQIFFATHSEHIIKDGLQNRDNHLIIVLKDNNGVIETNPIIAPSTLPSITSAETNYLAFNLITNDYHIELYGWLQQKESLTRIKDCDVFIKGHPKFEVAKHQKTSSFNTTTYDSICTYIRNAIDHPDSGNTFTEQELEISIKLLIEICNS